MNPDNLLPYTLHPTPYALVFSPPQWAAILLLVVLFFAPGLLRPLGRLLGRRLGMELRRRVGLPPRSDGHGGPSYQDMGRQGDRETGRQGEPEPPTPYPLLPTPYTAWWVAATVIGAVAALLWLLLRAR